ncbi:MAG: LCP family protein [Nocardioidaceae bacterium]
MKGRIFRRLALFGVLAATLIVVPNASVRQFDTALVKIDYAQGVDHPKNIIWVLAMGSDARPGETITRTRADAIQLVGINLKTGTGVILGTPRDSWVSIDGVGSNRVNAALYYGGPQLMAKTVGQIYGIDVDYALITGFGGFERMVKTIGGVVVDSDMDFSDDNLAFRYHKGKNYVNGTKALNFGRMRHYLPRGDFDRSAHQGELIKAIARKVKQKQDVPGFFEAGMLSALTELRTDLNPAELYRIAQAAITVNPAKIKDCVLPGGIGDIGGASVVIPNLTEAKRIGNDVRTDAKLDSGC